MNREVEEKKEEERKRKEEREEQHKQQVTKKRMAGTDGNYDEDIETIRLTNNKSYIKEQYEQRKKIEQERLEQKRKAEKPGYGEFNFIKI